MAKYDNCQFLKSRIDGRKIMCRKKGMANQRVEHCNEYVAKVVTKPDLLAWCN